MTAVLEQEQQYDITRNAQGELLIAIRVRPGDPQSPKILYDGAEHALLYRDPSLTVVLDYIHPQVRETLSQLQSVLIVERDGDKNIVHEYDAPVRMVSKLPLSTESLETLPEGVDPQYPEPEIPEAQS